MCTVLIVDDHTLIREGIHRVLETYNTNHFFDITDASCGAEGLEKAALEHYDIVITDDHMPDMNSLDFTRQITKHSTDTKVILMSADENDLLHVQDLINAGAKGYILKNIAPGELVAGIDKVINGTYYYSSSLAVKLIHESNPFLQKQEEKHEVADDCEILTKRDLAIINMIFIGKNNVEIAAELGLSKSTIDYQRQRIVKKLGVKNTAGLIKVCLEKGLITNVD